MVSLLVTVISIVLVSALAGVALYYGGAATTSGEAKARAAAMASQGVQITTALTLYFEDHGGYPNELDDLVTQKYLSAIPTTTTPDGTQVEWRLAVPGQPVVWAVHAVSAEVCQEVNRLLLLTDGVRTAAQPLVKGQCFGTASNYSVLFGGNRLQPASFIETVEQGAAMLTAPELMAATDGGPWVVAPTIEDSIPNSAGLYFVGKLSWAMVNEAPEPAIVGDFQASCPSNNVITQDSYGSASGIGFAHVNLWAATPGAYGWYDFGASPVAWHYSWDMYGDLSKAPVLEFCLPATSADQAAYEGAAFSSLKANMLYHRVNQYTGLPFSVAQALTEEAAASGQLAPASSRWAQLYSSNITVGGTRYGIYFLEAWSPSLADGTNAALFQIKKIPGGPEPVQLSYDLGWLPNYTTADQLLSPTNYKSAGRVTVDIADACTPDWTELSQGHSIRPGCAY